MSENQVRVVYSACELRERLPAPVATIGNFDGVHRGHRKILATLRERADALGGTAVVITFEPHPQKVLHPDSAPRLIATPEQKHRLLADAGADVVLALPFTRELAASSPGEFVRRTLLQGLSVREVWIGRNFRFGRDRAGDFETLERLGKRHGFAARPVEGVRHGDERISSSRVRHALATGDIDLARELLGREPELVGRVYRGDGRGRVLGYPTANLQVRNELIPLTGVYATRLVVDGRTLPSVTNIGSRPTFPGAGPAVETHVLDFDGDLYHRDVALRLAARLRDERRFSGVEALRARIAEDVADARRILRSG